MPVVINEITANAETPQTRSADSSASSSTAQPAPVESTQPETLRQTMLRLMERMARVRAH